MKYSLIFFAIILFILPSANAQSRLFKQPMFDDLEVKTNITITEADTIWVFEIKALDEDAQPDASRWYYWYIKEQIKSTQGNYSGKVLHGKFEKFDRAGNLLEKGQFNHGLKTGPWISYYPTGAIARTAEWNDGWRTGKFAAYYPTGVVSESGTFSKNKLSGTVTSYKTDGTVLSAIRYKNGVPVQEKQKQPADTVSARKVRQLKRETRKAEAQQKKQEQAAATSTAPDSASAPAAAKSKRVRKKKSEPGTVQP